MKENIKLFLEKYDGKSGEEIASERYDRFRNFQGNLGIFEWERL